MRHDRITAEALSCPLATTFVPPRRPRPGVALDQRLRTLLEQRLKLHKDGDRLEPAIARAWPRPGQLWLAKLRSLAAGLLEPAQGRMALRRDLCAPDAAVLRWRLLTLRMAPGLLAAAAAPDGVRLGHRVLVLPPHLAPNGPVAHQHLHYKVGLDFELLWTHVMSGGVYRKRPRLRGVVGLDEPSWRMAVARAALARIVLDAWLRQPEQGLGDVIRTLPLVPVACRQDLEFALGRFGQAAPSNWLPTRPTNLAIRRAERLVRQIAQLRSALSRSRRLRTCADLLRRDPIAHRPSEGADANWPEGRLLVTAFRQLSLWEETADATSPVSGWLQLFHAYVQVRCRAYAHFTMDPADRGLASFDRAFQRSRPYRVDLDEVLVDAAVERGDLPTLRSVELRTAPPTSVRECQRSLDRLRLADPGDGLPMERGFVFHLIRTPFQSRRGNIRGARLVDTWRRHMVAPARRLDRALRMRPGRLLWIRGLDVAGIERAGPLWMAASPLRRLRAWSDGAAARHGLPPLRQTVHVGEEFLHPCSGLRRIHEPLLWRILCPGDRLGHALALGIDLEVWCEQRPTVFMPRHERVLDLLWLLGRVREDGLRQLWAGEEGRLRGELQTLLAPWGIRNVGDDLLDFHRYLGDGCDLSSWRDPNRTRRYGPVEARWAQQFIGRGDAGDFVEVDTWRDVPLLVAIQAWLCKCVATAQLTVEVNVSSNFVVGGLDGVLDQPRFLMHPLFDSEGVAQVDVSVNTDDPLVFATDLAMEFACARAAVARPRGPGETWRENVAREWVERAAAASWRGRFTVAESADDVGRSG